MTLDLVEIRSQIDAVAREFFTEVTLRPGGVFVLGCSSSEICGMKIGKASNAEVGRIVIETLLPHIRQRHLAMAVQCCEHLNRALVMEEEEAERLGLEVVSVIPVLTAGGACATAAYALFEKAVVVEHAEAHAGMDIGDTEIGMHVLPVQVPVRLAEKMIGQARVTCLKRRPKFIGGARACYPPGLDNPKFAYSPDGHDEKA